MTSNHDYTSFQDALDAYFHLDLTADIIGGEQEQLGGGGFSDVFGCKMRSGWQPRQDPHIERLFSEARTVTVARLRSDSDCPVVAVKRVRLWGRQIPDIEKVFRIFLSKTRNRLS